MIEEPVGDQTGDNLQSLDKLVGDLISDLLHLINVFLVNSVSNQSQ